MKFLMTSSADLSPRLPRPSVDDISAFNTSIALSIDPEPVEWVNSSPDLKSRAFLNAVIINLILGYKKFLSPIFVKFFGHACRFTPTCSEYMLDAIEKYGVVFGGVMGVKRILRCHPFSKSGVDPVPEKIYLN